MHSKEYKHMNAKTIGKDHLVVLKKDKMYYVTTTQVTPVEALERLFHKNNPAPAARCLQAHGKQEEFSSWIVKVPSTFTREFEQRLIKTLDCTTPRGFNLTKGGGVTYYTRNMVTPASPAWIRNKEKMFTHLVNLITA